MTKTPKFTHISDDLAHDPTQYPEDLERLFKALENFTNEELAYILVELGYIKSIHKETKQREPRSELETLLTCEWPNNRERLLRALEPDGAIGQYLLADDPTQYPEDRERIEDAIDKLTDEELITSLRKLEQITDFDEKESRDPQTRPPRRDLEGYMTCGWPNNRERLLRALDSDGAIGQYLKDKDFS